MGYRQRKLNHPPTLLQLRKFARSFQITPSELFQWDFSNTTLVHQSHSSFSLHCDVLTPTKRVGLRLRGNKRVDGLWRLPWEERTDIREKDFDHRRRLKLAKLPATTKGHCTSLLSAFKVSALAWSWPTAAKWITEEWCFRNEEESFKMPITP